MSTFFAELIEFFKGSAWLMTHLGKQNAVAAKLQDINLKNSLRDPIHPSDLIDKMHMDLCVRHNRRVEHHGKDFWRARGDVHPDEIILDMHISQHTCLQVEREAGRTQGTKTSDAKSLYDWLE